MWREGLEPYRDAELLAAGRAYLSENERKPTLAGIVKLIREARALQPVQAHRRPGKEFNDDWPDEGPYVTKEQLRAVVGDLSATMDARAAQARSGMNCIQAVRGG